MTSHGRSPPVACPASSRTGAQAPAVTLPIAELVEEGVYPTGEIGCADTDTVLLGVARDQGDGRRQLGLCVVTVSTGRARSVWHEDYDLHGAVPDAERGCALRASIRRHDADDPLRHELWWCATARDALSSQVIDDGRQLWRRPVAWSDHGLCALTVERGRRRLEVLGDGRWTHVPTVRTPAGSVSSVVVEAATATWVESSPSTPPVLCRVDIGATRPPVVIDQGEAPPAVLGQIHHHQHLIASEPQQHATASTVMLPVTSEPRGVIALFHGGPTMAWVDWSWRWNAVPYLEQGYAVVLVDPAGSDGYGSASWRVAWRNWRHGITASAVRTLETALDRHGLGHLPLVTMGGSFGGYLAMAVAGELNPVLVAAHATPVRPSEVSLSSDAFWSWTREWGPLTDHARALERESLDLSLVPGRTRVLLSHGMLDEQVPFHQSVVAARELRMRGVQCDLVLLPDAGHALGRPDWIMKWYEWTLEALERIGEPATC
jgi:dipeptidyl aminopeptidase/acylaminoacyl peptidase